MRGNFLFINFLFISSAVLLLVASSPGSKECVEGRTYFNGCEHCQCKNHVEICPGSICWEKDGHGDYKIKHVDPPADFWQK